MAHMDYRIEARCVRVVRGELACGATTALVARPHAAFVLTRAGEMTTEFGPLGGGWKTARGSGGVAWYPAHEKRRTRATGQTDAAFTAALFSFEIFPGTDLLSFLDLPPLLPEAAGRQIGGALEQLAGIEEASVDPVLRHARRQELCYRILGTALKLAPWRPDAARRLAGLPRLLPVLEYLDQHFADAFDLGELADLAGLSRVQFHRRFKSLTGTSPFDYAKRLRLRLASHLLLDTDLAVAAVGSQVGWSDPFHFSKTFKAAYGQSPSAHRRHRHSIG